MRALLCLSLAAALGAPGCGSSTPASTTAAATNGELADGTPTDGATDGATDDAPAPAPVRPRLVTVTAVSGEVEGLMPNGEQWDAKEAARAPRVHAALATYLAGHPELADTLTTLGVPIDADAIADDARTTPAADPMVLIQLDGTVFRSPMRPRAFNPLWDFPFQFVVGPALIQGSEVAHIHVVDYDGPTAFDNIGTTLISVDDLLAKPVHELGPFGSVKRLTLKVETLELPEAPGEPSVLRIAVPGHPSWTDTGIDVVAGQRITIDAADEVCARGDDVSYCCGPEGMRAVNKYNLPGFETLGHAALVASIGDTRFAVKRELQLVAPASGRLRLGVNDRDTSNNRGSYAVRVTLSPPGR